MSGQCRVHSHGQERGWRFPGIEFFSHAVAAHGLDAGTGLGRTIEPEKMNAEP